MSAIFVAGDISKRTLAADDQRAVCETYPRADGGASDDAADTPSFAACAALSDAGTNDGGASDGNAGTNDGGATDTGGADATKNEDAPGNADATGEAGPPSPASDGCGCAVSQRGPRGSLLLLALLGVLVRLRRRCRTYRAEDSPKEQERRASEKPSPP
ncbi:MAG: hypothetical protein QOI66_2838 [Myxococcales bacterium]|jgi:MYXO-CTERM domain-containing protein|nr:hypothetical protein [Myxococcales bacterium]